MKRTTANWTGIRGVPKATTDKKLEACSKRDFFKLSEPDLKLILESAGFERYRASQIFDAVYKKKIFNPADFPSIPAKLKSYLSGNFEFAVAKLIGGRESEDETKKYLLELSDGARVECVLIKAPSEDGKDRKTLCLSTQVGCACACKFCASALGGFVRNLSSSEIVSEALPFVKDAKFEFENIVVMGMGEPLMNMDNLLAALNVFNSPEKFAFGARRITVSTCGIADKIEKLAEEKFPFRLAISLHGATDEVRRKIMPITNKFPLKRLIAAAEKFAASCGRMITLEYILIDGINDSFAQANELAKIARRLHAHVNLIPYNNVEGLNWKRSDAGRRAAFASILKKAGIAHTIRREKGKEIDAACGQLALRGRRAAAVGR